MAGKSVDQWFREYGESHQNPVNKAIHWICVPAITACVIAFLWEIPRPEFMQRAPLLNWGVIFVAAVIVLFYLRLSFTLAAGMLAFSAAVIAGIYAYDNLDITPVYQLALVVFVLAWIGQFIGHQIEGKKPSFFQDIQFLLIGPIWLLGFLYRKAGIPY